ncbi:alpha/beta hydrolase [Treponema zuelzerae]|uniref:Alpha/beta hydrolase n=2 Tax=Teretinema zuelzerae TaxID=156 RepID=A0AAE3ELT4_9SPIR|nr:alpha/beta hydrolase [Teretinema zuelzerae]MCD1656028.1 alpha/beta hydrolase [Teretinema zuelzerae]
MFIKSNDNASIYYDKTGIGPAILLIHGLGGDHTIWNNSGWIDELKNDFTVITFDLRGCGQSEVGHNEDFYSIENHLADITSILDYEEINDPILFGWSLGGTITTQYASKYRLKKAIVCGTYFGIIFSKEFIKKGIKGTEDIVLQKRMRALYKWPIIEPEQMNCPYLIYTGTDDASVYQKLNIQNEKIIKNNGRVVFFDKVDHFGLITQKEMVKNDVINFLKS